MTPRGRSDGFSLIGAIFLLVVVSTAAAAMLGLVGVQRRTSTFGLLEAHAYHAARSGVEWAMAKVVANPAVCPTDAFTLAEGGLSGFDVNVTCALTSHVEGAVTTNVFVVSAEAQLGVYGDFDFVSREIEVVVTVPTP